MLHGALLVLALLPLAAHGQAPAARRPTADSAAAIRQLFGQRRQRAGLGLAVGCGTMAVSANASSGGGEGSRMLVPPGAVAGLGTSGSLLSVFGLMRFSRKREQAALRCLVQHRPLPGYVQRSLGPLLAER